MCYWSSIRVPLDSRLVKHKKTQIDMQDSHVALFHITPFLYQHHHHLSSLSSSSTPLIPTLRAFATVIELSQPINYSVDKDNLAYNFPFNSSELQLLHRTTGDNFSIIQNVVRLVLQRKCARWHSIHR